MALTYSPQVGAVLICDFTTGFIAPEMVKKRPVVVISRKHYSLCTVVPLSTTEPHKIEPYHHRMSQASLPNKLANDDVWAKCDCVQTVAFARLDRIMDGKDQFGRRQYSSKIVSTKDLEAIRKAVCYWLCISIESS